MIPPPLTQINTGPWVAGYSLDALKQRIGGGERVVLPVCSFGTPAEEVASLGGLVLPPLYHEALDGDPGLKEQMAARSRRDGGLVRCRANHGGLRVG